ncbi:hypothetical protein Nocox_40715 [Nonomuraea coxensis DSM 45129]|uniref:Uncharacterized protein n=1 Tax=Nonomuraea coxensis DSM 45129 TaxID=1122611 RepID=A0ABX8UDZ7_9ACTN|nr:hypothetical protein [Nonomuraea coxensis]QYC45686.1 hypothetical protein Nocox_40715 [Nonomuraea coxensis DSM 45129]
MTSVEPDPERAAPAASGDWPGFVEPPYGLELLPGLGTFEPIFAGAAAGKQVGPAPGATWDAGFAALGVVLAAARN